MDVAIAIIVSFAAGYALKASCCRQDYNTGWDFGYECGLDEAQEAP